MKDMLIGPDSHKYKIPLEVLTTLLAGTPPRRRERRAGSDAHALALARGPAARYLVTARFKVRSSNTATLIPTRKPAQK